MLVVNYKMSKSIKEKKGHLFQIIVLKLLRIKDLKVTICFDRKELK